METKLRFRTDSDKLPTYQPNGGISFNEFSRQNDIKKTNVLGVIGLAGGKIHIFEANYITINGENIIHSSGPTCGANFYSKFSPIQFGKTVTCLKCLKRAAKEGIKL